MKRRPAGYGETTGDAVVDDREEEGVIAEGPPAGSVRAVGAKKKRETLGSGRTNLPARRGLEPGPVGYEYPPYDQATDAG